MYCSNCGSELEQNANFCSECGEKTEINKELKRVNIALSPAFPIEKSKESAWNINLFWKKICLCIMVLSNLLFLFSSLIPLYSIEYEEINFLSILFDYLYIFFDVHNFNLDFDIFIVLAGLILICIVFSSVFSFSFLLAFGRGVRGKKLVTQSRVSMGFGCACIVFVLVQIMSLKRLYASFDAEILMTKYGYVMIVAAIINLLFVDQEYRRLSD